MLTLVDGLLTILASSISYLIFLRARPSKATDQSSSRPTSPLAKPTGFIVLNTVSHARFLPKPSSHAFVYPTLSVFFDVHALTTPATIGNLGVGKNLFGIGPSSWRRVTNIRPAAYLLDDNVPSKNLVQRLEEFMQTPRLVGLKIEKEHYRNVWLLTSPSYLGFEGINPLSVWFCYSEDLVLRIVLLEVHNTFGERHVYVLQTGIAEDKNRPTTYDRQWTFPRQFHVSPFNDRSGYYTCAISDSLHPHHPSRRSSGGVLSPLPTIRLNLLTSSHDLKLTAVTRAKSSEPLTTSSLLRTLLSHPFILFLSLVRISYEAAKLHYFKRLDVYARPEPVSADGMVETQLNPGINPHQEDATRDESGVPVGWQPEGWAQQRARMKVHSYLERRVQECDISLTLISSNPLHKSLQYGISSAPAIGDSEPPTRRRLTIHYRSPLFFVLLLVLPSASHTLLLGSHAERLFSMTDDALFLELFEPRPRTRESKTQRFRHWCLPKTSPPFGIKGPPVHPLDREEGTWDWEAVAVILAYYMGEWIETALYRVFRARFVEGMEPWNGWERAKRRGQGISIDQLGSVRREL